MGANVNQQPNLFSTECGCLGRHADLLKRRSQIADYCGKVRRALAAFEPAAEGQEGAGIIGSSGDATCEGGQGSTST